MEILNTVNDNDYRKWLDYWQVWPNREIFSHPDYLKLYSDEKSAAFCAVSVSDEGCVIYPFLMRDLSQESFCDLSIGSIYDIISPYGYGGPCFFGDGNLIKAMEIFNIEFQAWAESNNVISEFVRFYLDSNTREFFPGKVEYNNDNIIVDLTYDNNARWMTFKHKVRKNVKKAMSSGIELEVDETGKRLDDFLEIYYCTMQRRSAKSGYYLPRDFFESLNSELKGHYVYLHAVFESKIIASELLLVSSNTIYSFLGGTNSDYFELRPNDFLKYHAICWGSNCNKKAFVLGGGYTPNDGIYTYKQSFEPKGNRSFYVGKRIFFDDIYELLIENREKDKGKIIRENKYFPLYRL